jgi:hypothetical protein
VGRHVEAVVGPPAWDHPVGASQASTRLVRRPVPGAGGVLLDSGKYGRFCRVNCTGREGGNDSMDAEEIRNLVLLNASEEAGLFENTPTS